MRIGFTGTRYGMTDAQKGFVAKIVNFLDPDEFHHGDCIGADSEANAIVTGKGGIWIVGHPPLLGRLRAYCIFDHEELPEDYLARNRKIVDVSDILIAAPENSVPTLRSGTWVTIRYAIGSQIPVLIVNYDGSVEVRNFFGVSGSLTS